MAFITNEQVKEKRAALRALFPSYRGWKFSVTGGNSSSITIALMQYPDTFTFPEYEQLNHYHMDRENLGEQEKEIMSAVKDIAFDGHWDKSEPMTDYFHCAYYVSIHIGKWDKPAIPYAPKQSARKVASEEQPAYRIPEQKTDTRESENTVIQNALAILESRIKKPEAIIQSPADVKAYLTLKYAELKHEVFSVLMLNNRHGILDLAEIFRGTIDGASVWPREIVKETLAANAAAVVLVHNHPSGHTEPSQADIKITQRLKDALALIDVRVLDHIIVAGSDTVSFAERGLI